MIDTIKWNISMSFYEHKLIIYVVALRKQKYQTITDFVL